MADDARQTACYHCGQPVPPGAHCGVEIEGATRPMCCPGCQAVAQAIVDHGLGDYYRHRTEHPEQPQPLVPDGLQELRLYDRPDLQRSFVREAEADVREASLILEGIVCAACVWLNERHVNALPGVLDFRINYSTQRAQLRWDPGEIQLSEVLEAIAAIGYRAHPFDPGRQEAVTRRERRRSQRRIAVSGVGMVQVMMFAVALYAGDYHGMSADIEQLMRWVSLAVAGPIVVYAAQPFFRSAWRDLKRLQPGMDVPVSLAITGALLASAWATLRGAGEVYFDSVTMFTFFLLVGRYLEMTARHRVGDAVERLLRLLPPTATRLEGDEAHTVAVSDLEPGDRVLVRPGETVPADGDVETGRSSLNEALLTGESLPLARAPGDPLVGGTVNVESPLVMRVRQVGAETVLSSIVRLLERAQSERPEIARLADRIAGWFVGALLVIAAGVFLVWWSVAPDQALWVTLSVLVVTCPCALSLATPAALAAATGSLTQLGVLTTRGLALETLARASDLVVDKTGTLTAGRIELTAVRPVGELAREDCLAIAAALEEGSEHPVARAIRQAGTAARQARDVVATSGRGIQGVVEGRRYRIGEPRFASDQPLPAGTADGSMQVWLADDTGPLAAFVLSDRLRTGAGEAVAELGKAGLRVHLLSGDDASAVASVAQQVGIDAARSRLLPEDKLGYIRGLQSEGRVVAMVGDGVNDAPVLAGADVSMAMGGGTQLAQASADMVLLSEDLGHIPAAVMTARRTLAIIRQNLVWALAYNGVALPLAALGWVAPWMAAIGMSASSLIVVVNALRLKEDGAAPHPGGTRSQEADDGDPVPADPGDPGDDRPGHLGDLLDGQERPVR